MDFPHLVEDLLGDVVVRSGVDVAVAFGEVADAVLADAFGLVFAVEIVPVG